MSALKLPAGILRTMTNMSQIPTSDFIVFSSQLQVNRRSLTTLSRSAFSLEAPLRHPRCRQRLHLSQWHLHLPIKPSMGLSLFVCVVQDV